jgi:hypothetical protein
MGRVLKNLNALFVIEELLLTCLYKFGASRFIFRSYIVKGNTVTGFIISYIYILL